MNPNKTYVSKTALISLICILLLTCSSISTISLRNSFNEKKETIFSHLQEIQTAMLDDELNENEIRKVSAHWLVIAESLKEITNLYIKRYPRDRIIDQMSLIKIIEDLQLFSIEEMQASLYHLDHKDARRQQIAFEWMKRVMQICLENFEHNKEYPKLYLRDWNAICANICYSVEDFIYEEYGISALLIPPNSHSFFDFIK